MSRRRRLFEGRAKVYYEGPEPGTLIQYFKDDADAAGESDGVRISGKGVLTNRISEFLMSRLLEMGIPNHFMRRISMREQLVREVEVIPIILAVRNVAAGSFAARFGLEEGAALPRSIVEYQFKSEELGNPMVSEEHITAFNWATPQDLDDIMALALRVNDYMSGLFLGVGLRMIDFSMEFGRIYNEMGDMRIILADEISPDSCRLWDLQSDRLLGTPPPAANTQGAVPAKVDNAYREVARRLGVLEEGEVITLNENKSSH